MASRTSGLNDRAGDRSTGTQQLLDDGRFQGDVARVVQACDGVDPRAIVDARVAFVGRRAGAVLHERANGGIAWPFRIVRCCLRRSARYGWRCVRTPAREVQAVVGLPAAVEQLAVGAAVDGAVLRVVGGGERRSHTSRSSEKSTSGRLRIEIVVGHCCLRPGLVILSMRRYQRQD